MGRDWKGELLSRLLTQGDLGCKRGFFNVLREDRHSPVYAATQRNGGVCGVVPTIHAPKAVGEQTAQLGFPLRGSNPILLS